MKPTAIQPATTVRGHSSCIVRRQCRNRRWAATVTIVLRAATFTLKTDGRCCLGGDQGVQKLTPSEVKPSDVEFWWSAKTLKGRPVLTQKYTEGARLEACPIRVSGVTVDLCNGAVEGFKAYDGSPRAVEKWARAMCSSKSFTAEFYLSIDIDKVLRDGCLQLDGRVWITAEPAVVKFTRWNAGEAEKLEEAMRNAANRALFRRVAAEMFQGYCSHFLSGNGVSTVEISTQDAAKTMTTLKEFQDRLGVESDQQGLKWGDHSLANAWPRDGLAHLPGPAAHSWFVKNTTSEIPGVLAVIAASKSAKRTVEIPRAVAGQEGLGFIAASESAKRTVETRQAVAEQTGLSFRPDFYHFWHDQSILPSGGSPVHAYIIRRRSKKTGC